MKLDRDRLRAVLEAEHSYYGSKPARARIDARCNPGARDLVASQFRPDMRVLDVGCGSGGTLLEHNHRFAFGLGLDNDPAHLRLAEEAKAAKSVANVAFRLMDFRRDAHTLERESFDFVFTERGPIGYDTFGIQAALRVLKPDGLIFCEVIGDLHQQEVRDVFSPQPRRNQVIRTSDQVKVAMERNGVSVRLAADIISKRYYPDVYEWLQFQCSIWAWAGVPFPSADDPRLELFADSNTTGHGEIQTTHHVVWVAGVKTEPAYHEVSHFDDP